MTSPAATLNDGLVKVCTVVVSVSPYRAGEPASRVGIYVTVTSAFVLMSAESVIVPFTCLPVPAGNELSTVIAGISGTFALP